MSSSPTPRVARSTRRSRSRSHHTHNPPIRVLKAPTTSTQPHPKQPLRRATAWSTRRSEARAVAARFATDLRTPAWAAARDLDPPGLLRLGVRSRATGRWRAAAVAGDGGVGPHHEATNCVDPLTLGRVRGRRPDELLGERLGRRSERSVLLNLSGGGCVVGKPVIELSLGNHPKRTSTSRPTRQPA